MPDQENPEQSNQPEDWNGPHLKDCPFCGHTPCRWDISDVLYPNGQYWRQEDGFRSYHSHKERQEGDSFVWSMHCTENHGGCGARLTADDMQEVIDKWNTRVNEETS